jgi:sugar phosphate isomerase/epimerase
MNRRDFLAAAAAGAALAGARPHDASSADAPAAPPAAPPSPPGPAKFRLGLVSYNIAVGWDLPKMLRVCKAAGIEGVEFRTTHAHKVEPALSSEARADVKKACADAGVVPVALGSVCEFHAPDPAVVQKNIETCRDFCKLAADIGAAGVKVRPNGLPKNVPVEKTLEQIGKALAECGKAAADHGVEIFVEVHGPGTSKPAHMRTILDACGHKAVAACWNSNGTDLVGGSVAESFALLAKDIRHCHINELVSGYPYRDLFARLRGIGYDRWTMIEIGQPIAEAADAKEPVQAIRFLKYYKALWRELAEG